MVVGGGGGCSKRLLCLNPTSVMVFVVGVVVVVGL